MKKFVRSLSILLMAGLLAAPLGGCGKGPDASGTASGGTAGKKINNGNPVKLVVQLDNYSPSVDQKVSEDNPSVFSSTYKLIEQFQKLYPNVTVEVDRSSPVSGINQLESLTQWIVPRVAAGTAMDVAVNLAGPTFFGTKGWFLEMKEYLEQPNEYIEGNTRWADEFPSYLMNQSMVASLKGEIQGVPYMLSPGPKTAYYYNKDIFQKLKLSVPKTWEELMRTADKLAKAGYTAIGAQPFNRTLNTQIWDMQFSIGPVLNNMLFDKIDYDKDGRVSSVERLRMIKDGCMDAQKNAYVMDAYKQVKRKYAFYPVGYQNTDFEPGWNAGEVAIMEDGLWRLPTELSNTSRKFEFGMFPPPPVSNDTYSYLPAAEYTEKGPDQPSLSNVWTVLKTSVDAHGAGVKEAAVEFVKFMSVPDNISSVVLEMRGAVLGAAKGTQVPPELNEWMSLSFPKNQNSVEWMPASLPENRQVLDKGFEQWMQGTKDDASFAKDYNEISQKDTDALIQSEGIDTTGW